MPELQEMGELSCVFFDGHFSHAALKQARPGEFRVNSRYGGGVRGVPVAPDIVRQARAVLEALDQPPLYARVDGVLREGVLILMELEVNEPGLMLDLDPRAADRFADATVRRIGDALR